VTWRTAVSFFDADGSSLGRSEDKTNLSLSFTASIEREMDLRFWPIPDPARRLSQSDRSREKRQIVTMLGPCHAVMALPIGVSAIKS
jgi:hypothetical protein